MFLTSLQTTFAAILPILIMGLCGYMLVRLKILETEGLNSLSALLINFFVPQFIFYQLTANFSYGAYPNWWMFPLMNFALVAMGMAISSLIFVFFKNFPDKEQFKALVCFQNTGYLPLLMATILFPPEYSQKLYVYIFLFIIGFDLAFWSLGVWLLTKHKQKLNLKAMLTPPIIAIAVSLIAIFFGWHSFVPDFILKPVKLFGDCTLPVAMLVMGGSLAKTAVSIDSYKGTGLFILAKMLIMPALALAIVILGKVDFLIGALLIIQAASPSAIVLSVVARHYQSGEKFINQGVFFSHILYIITLPLFLALYFKMVGYTP